MSPFSIHNNIPMYQFQQDNQYFIFNFDRTFEKATEFFQAEFWQKQERVIGSAKGRGKLKIGLA